MTETISPCDRGLHFYILPLSLTHWLWAAPRGECGLPGISEPGSYSCWLRTGLWEMALLQAHGCHRSQLGAQHLQRE